MKILFLTLQRINSLDERSIYSDLLRKFNKDGHEIYIVCPNERREKKQTKLIKTNKSVILYVKTLNIQKTSPIEKGLATLLIEYQFLNAVKQYFFNVNFDLVIYSTPPITFTKVINYIKDKDGAFAYLLLKDIFPQNAVDMKFIKKNGIIHKYFLKKEKKLYEASDKIGCMSQANLEYIIKHNSYLNIDKLEINPNSIIPHFKNLSKDEKERIKLKYSIPLNKKIFIYGGNLGKPQGLNFLLDTIIETKRSEVYFLVIGKGTELIRIQKWFQKYKPNNALIIPGLIKSDYDNLLAACDVGLIFLNKSFTIPNYPSRLLSYLEMKLPIIAATDKNSDVGRDIEKNKCGFGILSGDMKAMQNAINRLMNEVNLFNKMKENSWKFLKNNFQVNRTSELIIKSVNEINNI